MQPNLQNMAIDGSPPADFPKLGVDGDSLDAPHQKFFLELDQLAARCIIRDTAETHYNLQASWIDKWLSFQEQNLKNNKITGEDAIVSRLLLAFIKMLRHAQQGNSKDFSNEFDSLRNVITDSKKPIHQFKHMNGYSRGTFIRSCINSILRQVSLPLYENSQNFPVILDNFGKLLEYWLAHSISLSIDDVLSVAHAFTSEVRNTHRQLKKLLFDVPNCTPELEVKQDEAKASNLPFLNNWIKSVCMEDEPAKNEQLPEFLYMLCPTRNAVNQLFFLIFQYNGPPSLFRVLIKNANLEQGHNSSLLWQGLQIILNNERLSVKIFREFIATVGNFSGKPSTNRENFLKAVLEKQKVDLLSILLDPTVNFERLEIEFKVNKEPILQIARQSPDYDHVCGFLEMFTCLEKKGQESQAKEHFLQLVDKQCNKTDNSYADCYKAVFRKISAQYQANPDFKKFLLVLAVDHLNLKNEEDLQCMQTLSSSCQSYHRSSLLFEYLNQTQHLPSVSAGLTAILTFLFRSRFILSPSEEQSLQEKIKQSLNNEGYCELIQDYKQKIVSNEPTINLYILPPSEKERLANFLLPKTTEEWAQRREGLSNKQQYDLFTAFPINEIVQEVKQSSAVQAYQTALFELLSDSKWRSAEAEAVPRLIHHNSSVIVEKISQESKVNKSGYFKEFLQFMKPLGNDAICAHALGEDTEFLKRIVNCPYQRQTPTEKDIASYKEKAPFFYDICLAILLKSYCEWSQGNGKVYNVQVHKTVSSFVQFIEKGVFLLRSVNNFRTEDKEKELKSPSIAWENMPSYELVEKVDCLKNDAYILYSICETYKENIIMKKAKLALRLANARNTQDLPPIILAYLLSRRFQADEYMGSGISELFKSADKHSWSAKLKDLIELIKFCNGELTETVLAECKALQNGDSELIYKRAIELNQLKLSANNDAKKKPTELPVSPPSSNLIGSKSRLYPAPTLPNSQGGVELVNLKQFRSFYEP